MTPPREAGTVSTRNFWGFPDLARKIIKLFGMQEMDIIVHQKRRRRGVIVGQGPSYYVCTKSAILSLESPGFSSRRRSEDMRNENG